MKNMEEAQIKFFSHSPHSTDDLLSGHTQFLINFTISYDTNNINEILFLQKINQIHSPLPRLFTEVSCKLLN
jgi:hypothetical protein